MIALHQSGEANQGIPLHGMYCIGKNTGRVKLMRYRSVIKSGLLAWMPVLITLAVWIVFRGNNLVQLYQEMVPGFWVPINPLKAAGSWFMVWLVISLALSFFYGAIYFWSTQKCHWKVLYFAILLTAAAAAVSGLAYLTGIRLVAEAAGETLISAIGFGVLIPWFAQQNLRNYS